MECKTCEGEGVVLYTCDDPECENGDACKGHEYICPHCDGTGRIDET